MFFFTFFQLTAHHEQSVSTLIVLLINFVMAYSGCLSNMFNFLTKRGTCIKLMELTTYNIWIHNICHIVHWPTQTMQNFNCYWNQIGTFLKLPLIESFSALIMSMSELSRECMSNVLGRSCNTNHHRSLLK